MPIDENNDNITQPNKELPNTVKEDFQRDLNETLASFINVKGENRGLFDEILGIKKMFVDNNEKHDNKSMEDTFIKALNIDNLSTIIDQVSEINNKTQEQLDNEDESFTIDLIPTQNDMRKQPLPHVPLYVKKTFIKKLIQHGSDRLQNQPNKKTKKSRSTDSNKDKNKTNDDILTLDQTIQKKLQKEKDKILLYKKELEESKYRLQHLSNSVSYREKKILIDDIQRLDEKIYNIQTGKNVAEYVVLSQKLVNEYLEILKIPVKISFIKKKTDISPEIIRKGQIWTEFLKIAKKFLTIEEYTNLNVSSSQKPQQQEDNISLCICGSNDVDNKGDHLVICNICGKETEKIPLTSSYKDIDRINPTQTIDYERKMHFKDVWNQHQGKQNTYIKPKVFTDLDKAFEKHGLLDLTATTKEDRYKNITMDHVRMFLGLTKNNKQYENHRLIWSLITGKPLPDLSHLENIVIADFELLCETYDALGFNRTNFLNANFTTYQLLRRRGIKVREDDFQLLKTIERRYEYNMIYGKCCKVLGWAWWNLS